MLKELTEYYIPEEILHRDKQIKKVKSVFSNFKKNGIASNLLLMGVTGSGKTTIIKKIIESENRNVFGSGAVTKTSFKTLRAMFDVNCNTSERLLNEIIARLKVNPKIIIIDEVNRITDRGSLFDDLNTIYREAGCPIILITNYRLIREEMPEDVRLTLLFDKVEFPAYNAIELYDILKSRLNLIQDQIPKIPESALRKICAIGGKEASARVILNITLKCVLANDFSEKYIDEVLKNMEKEDWKDFVIGLKPTEKEFLRNLLDLQTKQKDIKPSEISRDMSKFTPSRISQLISAFEGYGIIESNYKNLGRRGGRTRVVNIVSQEIYDNLCELI